MVKHAAYNRLISFHKNKFLAYAEFDYDKLGPTRTEQEFLLLLLVYCPALCEMSSASQMNMFLYTTSRILFLLYFRTD